MKLPYIIALATILVGCAPKRIDGLVVHKHVEESGVNTCYFITIIETNTYNVSKAEYDHITVGTTFFRDDGGGFK